jgi:hypothetical protein
MEKDGLEQLKALREKRRKRRRRDAFWNLMTFFVFLSMMASGGLFIWIYLVPFSSLNPFPPPTLPVPVTEPTQLAVNNSETPFSPPPTTQTVVSLPTSSTSTSLPLRMPLPTASKTAESLINLTTEPQPVFRYELRSEPSAIKAFQLPLEKSCQWMGLGGQVIDLQNRPVVGILVQLGGNLQGKNFEQTSQAGTALQFGQAGFEFSLALQPSASEKTLWVQLIDQDRAPLSEKVFFDTFDECNKNLILINFKQVR